MRTLLRWLSRALAVAGAAALTWCAYVLVQSRLYQREAARELQRAPTVRVAPPEPTAEPPESESCEEETAPAPPAPEPPAPGTPLAQLEIPRLGLSAVVAEGCGDDVLRLAIGHIPGTAYPGQQGNVALSAHRDSFFRNLGRIRPNDAIRLTMPDRIECYVVDSFEIVGPKDVRVLAPSDESTLTLLTCYPFHYIGHAPKRFVVHAHRDDGEPAELASGAPRLRQGNSPARPSS
jgi:sortase A